MELPPLEPYEDVDHPWIIASLVVLMLLGLILTAAIYASP